MVVGGFVAQLSYSNRMFYIYFKLASIFLAGGPMRIYKLGKEFSIP